MRWPRVVTGGLALLLAIPAAAQEIVVWHAYRGGEKAAFEKVVRDYNARPGTKVKATTLAVPFDAFADKISAAVPRGKGPDVFIYAQDRLGGWVEAGNTVEPIDFFVDDALKARFIPGTVEALTYRGSLWGLPLNYKVIALVYNRKMIQQPPRTTAELVAVCKKIGNKAAGTFGLAYWYENFYYHAILMNAFGGGVFDARGRPRVDASENVRSLELLQRWIQKDGILPAEPSTALVTSLFNEGKAAMVFSGPWFLGEIAPGIDYGVTTLPVISEISGKPMRPWTTVEGVYIAAPSHNKEAAFEFLKYVTDVEPGRILAIEGRQSPANARVYADPKVASDPVLAAFHRQVEVAVPMPNVPEMTMVWGPASTAMSSIVKGATPKAAMDRAQQQVVQQIAGLRKGK
jgi:arabinogalactan oligomer/maltooligosaccharide transport system substrate-binding protein